MANVLAGVICTEMEAVLEMIQLETRSDARLQQIVKQNNVSPQELKTILKVFKHIDKTGDGFIALEELQVCTIRPLIDGSLLLFLLFSGCASHRRHRAVEECDGSSHEKYKSEV